MARNHDLAIRSRAVVAPALGQDPAAQTPDAMLGCMVAVALPASGPLATRGSGSSPLDTDALQARLVREHGIEVPIYPWPVRAAESPDPSRRLIRISAALHNGPDDADRLAEALTAIAREPAGASSG